MKSRLAIVSTLWIVSCGVQSYPFTPSAWKSTAVADRHVFFYDLKNRGLIIGFTREEVVCLLGIADYEAKDYISYVITRKPGGYNSVGSLDVYFKNGVVSEIRQSAD